MAEVLPIIGAVASALVWANNARTFVESIRDAPDVVKHLATDIVAIETPLRELYNLVEASNLNDTVRSQLAPILNPALEHCRKASQDVENALRPYVKPDRSPNINVWKKMSFTFNAGKVRALGEDLARCKATLIMALNISTILIQTKQVDQTLMINDTTQKSKRMLTQLQKHFDIETSSYAGSDIAEDLHNSRQAIKQWITQSATIREEDEQNDGSTIKTATTMVSAGSSETDSADDFWLVTKADKKRFDGIFDTVDTQRRGFISGEQAVLFFRNARVPDEALEQIWDLADMNADGLLNRDEFAVAMYLIREYRGSSDPQVPPVLPILLVPPSMRRPQMSRHLAPRPVRHELPHKRALRSPEVTVLALSQTQMASVPMNARRIDHMDFQTPGSCAPQ